MKAFGVLLFTFLLAEALGFGVQFTHPDGISYHKNALYTVRVSTPLEAVNLRRIQRLFNHMETVAEFDPHTRVDVWPDHEVRKGDNLIRVPPAIIEDFENLLDKSGFQYNIVSKDLQEVIENEAQENLLQDDSDFFSTYRTYEDFQEFMRNLVETYPSIAQLFYVGTTHEGRNITGVRVSGPSAVSKPGFFFIGGQHAREWIAPATVAFILNTLVTEYGQNSDVTSIVDGVEFFIVPLANPDGYVYTQTDRMWRKNRNKDRVSACYGVDNNRNWGYQWNTGGSSGVSCSETYHGSAAFSEKENIGLSEFVSNHSNIQAFIDFHSYGQLFMNPWGWTNDLSPDNTLQQQVSTAGEKAIEAVHGTKYEVGTDTQLTYIASGGSDDWVYGDRGAIYSYTIELRDTGKYGFLLPANQIVPQGEEAFAGVQYIAQYLLGL